MTSQTNDAFEHRVRQRFARAAARYADHAVLQAEIEKRTLERLDYFQLTPDVILDLGCGPGGSFPVLDARYPKSRKLYLDIAEAMLQQLPAPRRFRKRTLFPVAANMQHLPFADESIDLIVSSLALQWSVDLPRVLAECRRVLRPHGLLLFATLGPDTLWELRTLSADDQPLVRVNPFPDMHDVGDALVRAGLADPVLDRELICVEYPTARAVLKDLKNIGANTVQPTDRVPTAPAKGLRGGRWLNTLETAYERHRRTGTLPATFEVVYGHASRPPSGARPQDGSTVKGGEVHVPVDAIVRRPPTP